MLGPVTALISAVVLACVVRGPADIDASAPEWKKATVGEKYERVWAARDVPSTAALADGVMAELLAQKPETAENLWRVAAYRWWVAEGEQDAAKRKQGLDAALDLTARALKREPDLVPARYYAALARFTQAGDAGWTPAARAAFLADADAVLKRAPGYDGAGTQAVLGRYWLAEGDVAKAAAQVSAGYALAEAQKVGRLNARLRYVSVLALHRATPRDPRKVSFELQRMLAGCGDPDGLRTMRWLKPDWTAITGEKVPASLD